MQKEPALMTEAELSAEIDRLTARANALNHLRMARAAIRENAARAAHVRRKFEEHIAAALAEIEHTHGPAAPRAAA